jgi:hypothetical protein
MANNEINIRTGWLSIGDTSIPTSAVKITKLMTRGFIRANISPGEAICGCVVIA